MWAVVGAFAFLTIYFTGVFPRANPNDLSRFETVVAMGEWRTFSIDRAIALLGDHEDKSASGGLFFSNKAPGLALAALPVYLALRLVLPLPASGTSGLVFYVVRLLTVTLASVVALSFLARRIDAERKEESVAPLVVLAVGFGTPMLFYARSFFSHAWTASLLFLAWELLRRGEETGARRSPWTAVLAGFLAALAAISEYTVAPIALLLAVRAGVGATPRRLLEFALGALPVLGFLLAYNAASFGSPFVLSYAREATPEFAKVASQGFSGFRRPSLRIGLAYLFHPARGVLVFSPFLAWSALGIVRWWRSRADRRDCVFVIAVTSLFFVLLTLYPNWHGGGSLGSRYLLPGLFFVAVPLGRSLCSPLSRGLFLAAATFAVAQHFLLTATYPHFGLGIPWPAFTASPWFLERGFVAPNVLSLMGVGPLASLVLPLAATLTALFWAARHRRPMRPRVSLALLAGLAPFAALMLWRPPVSFEVRLRRASIFASFSDLDPGGEELRAVMREATTSEERRRAEDAWRHFASPAAGTP